MNKEKLKSLIFIAMGKVLQQSTNFNLKEAVSIGANLAEQIMNELEQASACQNNANINKPSFKTALAGVINSYSKENGSNTPDFILAEYLENCLHNWNATVLKKNDFSKMGMNDQKAIVSGVDFSK